MEFKELADYIIKKLIKNSIDECDVIISEAEELEIEVRLNKIEKILQSKTKALGIRTIKNKKTAITYTSDFNLESIDLLISNAISFADITNSDDCNGLPEKSLSGIEHTDLLLNDDKIKTISIEEKIKIAKALEEKTLSSDKRLTNSDGSWWSEALYHSILMNSNNFIGEKYSSINSFGISVLAEVDNIKQKDHWFTQSRFFDNLESIDYVADTASKRTLRKIGAKKVASQKVPVVFDPLVGSDFLGIIADAVLASNVWRKTTFLHNSLNETIANPLISIVDNPLLIKGLSSRNFDGESIKSQVTDVIVDGKLINYLSDSYSARKLNIVSTSNAGRAVSSVPHITTTNFYLKNGNSSPEEIIGSVKNGLYLTKVFSVGVNLVTGDYSRGAEGIWIENGKLTYPVQEITIAGNIKDMLNQIEMLGNDLTFRYSINSPTFLISEMSISGK